MERRSKRPDIRFEPTLYTRLKEYCAYRQVSIASLIRDLVIEKLKAERRITADDFRQMRGL